MEKEHKPRLPGEAPPSDLGISFEYMFDSATLEPPTSGEIRFNNSRADLVTKVWVHKLSSTGDDNSNYFTLADERHRIFIQDKDESSKWVSYNLTGPTHSKGSGSYTEFPCILRQMGPTTLAQQRVLMNIDLRAVEDTTAPESGLAWLEEQTVAIKYVGKKKWTVDSVANTGITWSGNGAVKLVPIEAARKLIQFPDQWEPASGKVKRRHA